MNYKLLLDDNRFNTSYNYHDILKYEVVENFNTLGEAMVFIHNVPKNRNILNVKPDCTIEIVSDSSSVYFPQIGHESKPEDLMKFIIKIRHIYSGSDSNWNFYLISQSKYDSDIEKIKRGM